MKPPTNVMTFCSGWFRAKKHPITVWKAQMAADAHERGEPYTVVLGDPPSCFIEVVGKNRYVGVGFLDTHLREFLSYRFQEKEPGRLFLTMATHRNFDAENDHVREGTTYYFEPNGKVIIERVDFKTRVKERSETSSNVEHNWEPMPGFGDYEGVSRIERDVIPR
jgi:hypothetical protein